MSRMVNPGPPEVAAMVQGRSGQRPWPGEPAWRSTNRWPAANVPKQRAGRGNAARTVRPAATGDREPTLVLDVDLREPLPEVAGGVVTRVWLMLRVGDVEVGELLLAVPQSGLTGRMIGATLASRIGARQRPGAGDDQPRSRKRGSTSEL